MKTFASCERVFIDVIDFENYKTKDGAQTLILQQIFEYDIIKNIPKQVEKFFEIQQFDLDASLETSPQSSTGTSAKTTPSNSLPF